MYIYVLLWWLTSCWLEASGSSVVHILIFRLFQIYKIWGSRNCLSPFSHDHIIFLFSLGFKLCRILEIWKTNFQFFTSVIIPPNCPFPWPPIGGSWFSHYHAPPLALLSKPKEQTGVSLSLPPCVIFLRKVLIVYFFNFLLNCKWTFFLVFSNFAPLPRFSIRNSKFSRHWFHKSEAYVFSFDFWVWQGHVGCRMFKIIIF